jgi:hypothetical protein
MLKNHSVILQLDAEADCEPLAARMVAVTER